MNHQGNVYEIPKSAIEYERVYDVIGGGNHGNVNLEHLAENGTKPDLERSAETKASAKSALEAPECKNGSPFTRFNRRIYIVITVVSTIVAVICTIALGIVVTVTSKTTNNNVNLQTTVETTKAGQNGSGDEWCNENIFNGSCYYFSNYTASWFSASDICKRKDSHLAVADTVKENEYLKFFSRFYILSYSEGFLIDGTDMLYEGVWKWNSTGKEIIYFDWARDQPDNRFGGEDCLEIWKSRDYKWNDISCNNPTRSQFICERELTIREFRVISP